MIVCRECGHHNPTGTTFCENRDCGSFLEWSGEQRPTAMVPRVDDPSRPGRGGSGPRLVGRREVGLTARLLERELNVEPGASTSCEITVRNTGRVVDQYKVEVVGDSARWTTVEPAWINLVPDAEGSVRVTFHPPRRPRIVAGITPFRLIVASREDPSTVTFADGTINVAPFYDLAMELRPQVAEGRSAVYEVGVANRGNAPVVTQLDAIDDLRALEFQISQPTVSVPPGGRTSVRVSVRPRRRPLSGPVTSHMFRVVVQSAGEAPRSMDAQFLHRPLLPPIGRNWLVVLRVLLTLAGALAMILGAFADWFSGVRGVDLTYEQYVEDVFGNDVPSAPDAPDTIILSLGLVAIVLGVLALFGLASRTGLLTRLAAGLLLLLMGVFIFTVVNADISLGSGAIIVLAGAVVALLGGIAGMAGKT
jgi:hypothetical protein